MNVYHSQPPPISNHESGSVVSSQATRNQHQPAVSAATSVTTPRVPNPGKSQSTGKNKKKFIHSISSNNDLVNDNSSEGK